MTESDSFYPRYKLLNYNVEWKKTLLNYKNIYLTELITDLKELDNLRDVIMQNDDNIETKQLIQEYETKIFYLKNSGFINRRIDEMLLMINKQEKNSGYFKEILERKKEVPLRPIHTEW